ncbi:DEAD/DEAH box helicase [Roseateles sp.]|uniref:DEAD/DEAH box helicase n=1 Tax=Roseateles sp. TaxID=1971397 RepID=UPI00286BB266|nr:DEAD/DEAH box helicase [Roseateles sp.]
MAIAPKTRSKTSAKTVIAVPSAPASKPKPKAASKAPAARKVLAVEQPVAKPAAKVAAKVAAKAAASAVPANKAAAAKKAPSKKLLQAIELALAAAPAPALAKAPERAPKPAPTPVVELPLKKAVAKAVKKAPAKQMKQIAAKAVVLAELPSPAKPRRAPKLPKAAAVEVVPPVTVAPAVEANKTAKKSAKKSPAKPQAATPVAAKPIAKPAPVPAVKPVPVPAPVPVPKPPAKFSLQRPSPTADGVFGDYRVAELSGGQSWTVSVRGTSLIDCRCTCADFCFGERGSCEHVEFALGSLLDEPQQRAALEQGLRTDYSEILLGYGAARYLRWRQGQLCPPELAREAQALLDERGRLPADDADDVGLLSGLLQLAAELGAEVRVEAGVWEQMALGRDARQRVQCLAQAYPQGLESPALRGLLKLPLPLYQLESALFAACAGRSLVADDLGLGQYAPAFAATELFARHFGVERVLVLCAESAQTRWLGEAQTLSLAATQMVWGDADTRKTQCQSQGQGLEIKIASLASLGRDMSLLQGFAAELIVVDEAARLDVDALAALRQLDRGFLLMLSGQLLDERPQALLPLVDLLDRSRNGPWERFLSRHVRRSGQTLSYFGLERLDQTLERVMFSRSRAELLPTLPVALVQLRAVALTPQQLLLQQPLLAGLRQAVARWQRSAYVSAAELLQLQQTLQQLRRLAISPQLLMSPQQGMVDAPKLSAVAALTRELLGGAAERLLVFSQWDDALGLLAERLQAGGIDFVQLHAERTLEQRLELLRRWRHATAATVLLCSDKAVLGLDLQIERVAMVNLELPWGEDLLEQRLLNLVNEHSRGLPMIQLLAQTGLEQAMLQVLDNVAELPSGGLDGDASRQLLSGDESDRFMHALTALCGALTD